MSHTRAGRAYVLIAALLVAAAASITFAPAAPAASSKPTLVVIGDSITYKYNDKTGSDARGWWSFLAGELKVDPVTFGENGSGYSHRGRCVHSTFGERLLQKKVKKAVSTARVVVVEGGINDWARCFYDRDRHKWVLKPAKQSTVQEQVHLTLGRLSRMTKDARSVYVTAPWGTRRSSSSAYPNNLRLARPWVTALIRTEAERYGFTYVDTADDLLDKSHTRDGIHPNLAGSKRISRAILSRSDISRWTPGWQRAENAASHSKPVPTERPEAPATAFEEPVPETP